MWNVSNENYIMNSMDAMQWMKEHNYWKYSDTVVNDDNGETNRIFAWLERIGFTLNSVSFGSLFSVLLLVLLLLCVHANVFYNMWNTFLTCFDVKNTRTIEGEKRERDRYGWTGSHFKRDTINATKMKQINYTHNFHTMSTLYSILTRK